MDAVLTDAVAINRLAADFYRQGATHLAPIFNAALAGQVAAVGLAKRNVQFPRREVASFRLPTVLIVGDDDDAATGPTGWRSAKEATHWAAAAIVHGAGAERGHYDMAVASAVRFRRLLLIETRSQFVRPWGSLLEGKPRLAIMPRTGPHPVIPTREHFH